MWSINRTLPSRKSPSRNRPPGSLLGAIKRSTWLVCFGAWLIATGVQAAETVEEVVLRYEEAIGGVAAWRAVDSMRLEGAMVMEDGTELQLIRVLERPGRMRQDVRIGQRTGIFATDGEVHWARPPGATETRALPAAQVGWILRQAEIESPLLDWRAKGHSVRLVGEKTLEGQRVYHLRLRPAGNQVEDHYLDAESFLPVRVEWEAGGEEGGREGAMNFSDYERVGELTIPHTVTVEGAFASRTTFRSIELDVDTADVEFSPADLELTPPQATRSGGFPGWDLLLAGGARARLEAPAGVENGARVSIVSARTGVDWHIGLARGTFPIERGERYRLRFRARADGPRDLSFTVMQVHPPFRTYIYEQVGVTPLWNTIEREFEARFGDQEVRVQFNAGESRWPVDVSEVSLVRLRDGEELIPEPDDS